jgi:23S rRNA (guanosine2251-2'-O)-methyltransferase
MKSAMKTARPNTEKAANQDADAKPKRARPDFKKPFNNDQGKRTKHAEPQGPRDPNIADDWLYGINAIEGQINADPSRIVELWIENTDHSERLRQLAGLADRVGLKAQRVSPQSLTHKLGTDKHQGAAARYRAPELMSESDLTRLAVNAGPQALFLLLDNISDPHNLGACIRSAAAAGVTAVVFPKDKSAGLTPAVLRASAGTAARMPLVSVTNFARAIEVLKEAGVWCYGAAGEAEKSVYQQDLKGPVALVLGSEGEGLRRLSRERCDGLIRIPMASDVESLNVSVATGILLFEVRRQRGV